MDELDTLLNNLVTERNRADALTGSREMALTITKIDEAIMWASAAKTIIQLNNEVSNQPPA